MEDHVSDSNDGRHDFDFLFGDWKIVNRKLVDTTDPECDEWVEFSATSHIDPFLGGFGNVDRMWSDAPPGGSPFEGFTLRQFDPEDQIWRIWWASSTSPGHLDPPVEGRWRDGRGTFSCTDTIAGRDVIVRFEWSVRPPSGALWEQSFSFDGGETWKYNWTMTFSR